MFVDWMTARALHESRIREAQTRGQYREDEVSLLRPMRRGAKAIIARLTS